jgi:hypothetical protein
MERNRCREVGPVGGDGARVVGEVHTNGVVIMEVQSGWFRAGDELLAWRCLVAGF